VKTAIIFLYGFIGEWFENSAEEFARRLDEAAVDADQIELHIHCYGGDVLEGNAMYNKIKNCPKPVDVYIDGVSASMATIVMLAGRKIYMSENAFLMIHSPSGCVCGSADEMLKSAKMLQSLEALFIKFYTTKTGKTESEVKAWMTGDNWFSSQEALAANLIDGIVDPISEEIKPIAKAELTTLKPRALYDRFAAIAKPERFNPQNTKNEMKKEDLITRYGLTGVTAESSDEAVLASVDQKIAAERTEKERLQGEKETASKKVVTDAVQAAIDDKRITAEQRDIYVGIGEKSGFDALSVALKAINKAPTIIGALGGKGNPEASDRTAWDWDKWQKEDQKGLQALAKSDEAAFQALYDAKFKK